MRSDIACDCSNSDGFGGIAPLVRTYKPVPDVLLQGVVEGRPPDEHAGRADRVVEAQSRGQLGLAEVALDQSRPSGRPWPG